MRQALGSLQTNVKAALAAAADFILPPLCVACHRSLAHADSVCPDCWRKVRFISTPMCDRLGIPMPYDTGTRQVSVQAAASPPDYDRARAAAHYMHPVREMITALKYSDRHEPRRLLGKWLRSAGRDLLADAHVLIPVPLSRRRLLSRRFNQSAELARELSLLTGTEYAPQALARLKNTRQQVGLTQAQRAENVRGAFKVPKAGKAMIEGRNVLLIDDVITTGATVNACARALRRAGAARIDVLAVAMATDYSRAMGD